MLLLLRLQEAEAQPVEEDQGLTVALPLEVVALELLLRLLLNLRL